MALNEDLFRRMNERLHTLATVGAVDSPDESERFLCECADTSCARVLELDAEEYRAVRETSRRFLVFPDDAHTSLTVEKVVERHEGYWVVEKTGDAGEEAEALADDNTNTL